MLAVGFLPKRDGVRPRVEGIGCEFVRGGVRCWLLRAPIASRARVVRLKLLAAPDGREVATVRVRWPHLGEGEWRDVTLEYHQ